MRLSRKIISSHIKLQPYAHKYAVVKAVSECVKHIIAAAEWVCNFTAHVNQNATGATDSSGNTREWLHTHRGIILGSLSSFQRVFMWVYVVVVQGIMHGPQ